MPTWLLESMNNGNNEKYTAPKLEAEIREGIRNESLASLAGSMRRRGLTRDEMLPTLRKLNETRCESPLSDGELKGIAEGMHRYDPEDPLPHGPASLNYHLNLLPLTDAGNGEAMALLFEDHLKFNHTNGNWLIWNRHFWSVDKRCYATQMAKFMARQRQTAAVEIEDIEKRKYFMKWALRSESHSKINATLKLASSEPKISTTIDDHDQDPMLFACSNGVIDLRTGEIRDGKPEDMISIWTPIEYELNAVARRWEQFLDEVFSSDKDLIAYIKRCIGYSMTGCTREQCLFLLYGTGENGKSVFSGVLHNIFGDYAANTPFSTFLSSQFDASRIPNDLAALANKRLVTASEVKERSKINEERIKSVTGCDPISARFLHQEYFTYVPKFKIWLAVNHKPRVDDTSHAFWRRIQVVPFERRFREAERDKDLSDKLASEYSGILNWAIEGCLDWQKHGLDSPEKVRNATQNYRDEADVLRTFLKERTTISPEAKVGASELYGSYREWCEESGEKAMTRTMFGRRISSMGFQKKQHGPSRRITYFGLGLLET
jgi:putative DNA primase/helicase